MDDGANTGARQPGELFAQRTGFLLSRVGLATTNGFRAALEPLGIRPPHWAVLNVVDDAEVLSQQELGGIVRIDPSSIVRVIDDLERDGLVERRRDTEDRRRYAVALTPAGRRVLARARKIADAHEERILEPLSAAERQELHALLLRLAIAGHLPATPHPRIDPDD
jgi:DNA-binding MarR family transcriptional regulator